MSVSPPADGVAPDSYEAGADRRAEILQWLRSDAPPLADMFLLVVRFLDAPLLPGSGRFVCHGVREIGNRLFGQLVGGTVTEHTDYGKLVESFRAPWSAAQLPIGEAGFEEQVGLPPAFIQVPTPVVRDIAVLLEAHEAVESRMRRSAQGLFDVLNKEAGGLPGETRGSIDRWVDLLRWFNAHCHVPVSAAGSDWDLDPVELKSRWAEFEVTLYSLCTSFSRVAAEVAADMKKEVTAANVRLMVARFSRVAISRFFFLRQENPAWLKPLTRSKCFSKPPELIEDPEGGPAIAPRWHEGEFLVRMAAFLPDDVLKITKKLPASNNPWVNRVIADIALMLEPKSAAALADRLASAFLGDRFRAFETVAPQLISKFAAGKQFGAARKLAVAYFAILKAEHDDDDDPWRLTYGKTAHEPWTYRDGLKTALPAMLAANAPSTIELLCDLLYAVVKGAKLFARKPERFDHSLVFGDRIEHLDDDAATIDIGRILPAAISTSMRDVIVAGTAPASVFAKLASNEPEIFRAIEIHVLAEIGPHAADLAVAKLGNLELLADARFETSIGALVSARFAELTEPEQSRLLARILEGPDDAAAFNLAYERSSGSPPTGAISAARKASWMRKRLRWIPQALLPAGLAAMLEQLDEQLRPYDRQELHHLWNESPKDAAELRTMSATAVADYLKTWLPDAVAPVGSVAGLTVAFSHVIDERAFEFSEISERFIEADESYVRQLLWSLMPAAQRAAPLDWQALLRLCSWIIGEQRSRADEQPDARETRRAVADLLREGLRHPKGGIPDEYAPDVWSILEALAADADTVAPDESTDGDQYAERGFATVQGMAIDAVVHYALWRGRTFDRSAGTPPGFDAMPEVQSLLETYLDPAARTSPAVRSVYGRRFEFLVYLDPVWATRVRDLAFPNPDADRISWRAAWRSYLRFGQVYSSVFEVLRPKYELAVGLLDGADSSPGGTAEEQALGEHLILLFAWGHIELSVDDPVSRYFQQASLSARKKTLDYAGRRASGPAPLPSAIADRLMSLVDARIAAARAGGSEADHMELQGIGSWFISGKFDIAWSLAALDAALELAGGIGSNHQVVNRLALVAATHSHDAVDCLLRIVKSGHDSRNFFAHDDAAQILKLALAAEDDRARKLAEATISILGERGDASFLRLLQKSGGQGQP